MRIAVPYENGSIFQHFGRTAAFKLYDAEDGEVRASAVQSTDGSGHGALVGFLRDKGVDALICGGVSGGADEAVRALLDGRLAYDPDVRCGHHDHAHGEEAHTCGAHGCGHGCKTDS